MVAKAETNKKQRSPASSTGKENPLLIFFLGAGILSITFIFLYPVLENGFTNWDDQGYVLENDLVKSLSVANLKEIFTTPVMGNYHPLAILSLALDYRIFGPGAGGFHFTNLLFHLLSVAILFVLTFQLTHSLWIGGITSLLFGIHPMHVESVAWISERKDVGYVLFYFLAMWSYLLYTRKEKRKGIYYAGALLLFLVSLLFKGQAVTLPLALLLIDFLEGKQISKTWKNKIPFFLLAIAFGIIAVLAQKESNTIQDIKLYPYIDRIFFACYAFAGYIIKSVVPFELSAFYPYPEKDGDFYSWPIYSSVLLAIDITWLLLRIRKRNKNLFWGSAFFIINIFLLLQLLPVGNAIMADRYSYLAYTGIFFLLGSVIRQAFFVSHAPLKSFKVAGVVSLFAYALYLGFAAHARAQVWHDSRKLFTDVVNKYPRVAIAYNNLGTYYQKQDLIDMALVNFNTAIAIQPDFPDALVNRSDIYRVYGKLDSSIFDCTRAIARRPDMAEAYMNRGIAYSIAQKYDSAMQDFNRVISLKPKNARVYGNRGNLFSIKGSMDSALADYNRSIRLDPSYRDVYGNRGRVYIQLKQIDNAIADLNKAVYYFPTNPENYFLLCVAYQEKGEWKLALENATQAKSLGKEINEASLEFLRQKAASE